MTGFGNDERDNSLRSDTKYLTDFSLVVTDEEIHAEPPETVTAEAERLVCGRRGPDYGHPLDNLQDAVLKKFAARVFETGATRDTETDKLDYEGFLSPLVLERYATYMHKHRVQKDGSLRDSDNWQKGMPKTVYMKSMWRHFMDAWKGHRELPAHDLEESLCALLFNANGYLHELLRAKVPPP